MHFNLCLQSAVAIGIAVQIALLTVGTSAKRDPYFLVHNESDLINTRCTFRVNGTAGVCKWLPDCESANAEAQSDQQLMPTVCGISGKTLMVCCLAAESRYKRVADSPSQRGESEERISDFCIAFEHKNRPEPHHVQKHVGF